MRPLSITSRLEDVATHVTSASSAILNNHRVPPRSPWQSPVPYLFGGLAAMIGLIAFSLLILACSYWRLSTSGEEDGHNVDGEIKESGSGDKAVNETYDEKFLVIMAGDDLPRFLATPAMKKCTCDGHEGKIVISQEEEDETMKVDEKESE